MTRTKLALCIGALALAGVGCGRNKNGAGDVDDVGMHASMAVDAKGNVCVSSYWRTHKLTATHQELVGALVYTKGKIGHDGVVDFGKPVVVDGDLRDTKNPTGGKNVGLYTSLQLNKDGLARISYYDKDDGDLKYAYETAAGKWTIDVVDAAGNVGGYTSLVLENDQPRIAYYDFDNLHLKFAAKIAGTWSTTTVDDNVWDSGKFTSIASDGNGNLGIAYYDNTNGDLGYAFGSAAGPWTIEWVDTTGDTGRWPSLAYNLGTATIAYQDNTNQHLMLGTRNGDGTWGLQVVDSAPWVGADTAMSIDRFGMIHIAYFDGMDNDVLYAKYDGTNWSLAKVAQEGANGYFNNLVLDANDAPIFGWYSYTGTAFNARAGVPAAQTASN
jgi:hypothetical protein